MGKIINRLTRVILATSIGFTILMFGTYLIPLVVAEIALTNNEVITKIMRLIMALGIASSAILVVANGLFGGEEDDE